MILWSSDGKKQCPLLKGGGKSFLKHLVTYWLMHWVSFNPPVAFPADGCFRERDQSSESLGNLPTSPSSWAGFKLPAILALSSMPQALLWGGQSGSDVKAMPFLTDCSLASKHHWHLGFCTQEEALVPGPLVYRSGVPRTWKVSAEPKGRAEG